MTVELTVRRSLPWSEGVYHGQKEFTYSDADFSRIASWPLYEQGLRDLPVDLLVSIGYTVNTFGGTVGGNGEEARTYTNLLTNLQFIIFLALPANE
jgi:hypothetical protein